MARATKPAPATEFVSREDAERMAQEAAGRAMMTLPESEPETVPEPDPDDIALANVLAELGSSNTDAKVNIYQLDERQNRAFIGAFLPSEFSLEKVQAEYGAGKYEIRAYSEGRLVTRKVVTIAAPKVQTAAQQTNMVQGLDSQKLVEVMNAGFAQLAQGFTQSIAALVQNQPKPKSTMEMLQEMQMMREIMGMNNPVAAPDPLKLVEIATQLADKITPRVGEPGTGEVIMEAIKNFGPMITGAIQQQRAQLPMLQNPVMTAPIPLQTDTAPLQVNPIQSAPQNQEPDEMNLAKRMYLNLLIRNAAAGNDTLTYANLMLDVAGENEAVKFANDPQWFEKLCQEEPRAKDYQPWFDQLRNDVLELTAPDDGAIDTGTSATSPDNVP